MKFFNKTAEVFVPDGRPVQEALQRTTHLAIGAHQDDLEIMAAAPILECFQKKDLWFSGVVVTDGAGSPRAGIYQQYSDQEMRRVRFQEQRKAAMLGEYAALVMLDYPSSAARDGKNARMVDDLSSILKAARPAIVFTHNLADKHDTHVGVALKTVDAIRRLPAADRPQKLYGCEVWRGLDWMVDEDKVEFNLSGQQNLQNALVAVFDSQISGGKRYDLAVEARHRTNATYFKSHTADAADSLAFAMDMTPLIQDETLDPLSFIRKFLERFGRDVEERLERVRSIL